MSQRSSKPQPRHPPGDSSPWPSDNSLCSSLVLLFLGGLAVVYVVLFCLHTFWFGEPIALHCQAIDVGQTNCVLTYRALLRRSWDWSLEGVEAIQIDTQTFSSSEGGQTETRYVVVLHAEGEEHVVRQYPRPDHPDLEMWQHRISQFSEHPEEGFAIAVDYNPWQPLLIGLYFVGLILIATFLLFLIPLLIGGGILLYLAVRNFLSSLRATALRSLATKGDCIFQYLLHSRLSCQAIYSHSAGATPMAISLRQSGRFVPTLVLLVGLALGSFGLVVWLGLRWVVVLGSGVVWAGAIALWRRQLNHHKQLLATAIDSANLLQKATFLAHLNHLEAQFSDISPLLWQATRQRAEAIRQIAEQIAQQETTFIPDLLEALHTVLDLVEQLAHALKAIQQVKTYRYQQLAQEQLYRSQKRLEHTHNQLQALRDQMILNPLQQRSSSHASDISTWLQTLIADNEKGLLGE